MFFFQLVLVEFICVRKFIYLFIYRFIFLTSQFFMHHFVHFLLLLIFQHSNICSFFTFLSFLFTSSELFISIHVLHLVFPHFLHSSSLHSFKYARSLSFHYFIQSSLSPAPRNCTHPSIHLFHLFPCLCSLLPFLPAFPPPSLFPPCLPLSLSPSLPLLTVLSFVITRREANHTILLEIHEKDKEVHGGIRGGRREERRENKCEGRRKREVRWRK